MTADYCNYDSAPLGVQFYGIGPEHVAAEAFCRAATPAAVLALIALARHAQPEGEAPQAAAICDRLAAMMEQGGGELNPGERLRQAARMIRELPAAQHAETGAQAVVFMGVDPLGIINGATLPMVPDSWRFAFYKSDDELRFGHHDNGPLVAWEAVKNLLPSTAVLEEQASVALIQRKKIQALQKENADLRAALAAQSQGAQAAAKASDARYSEGYNDGWSEGRAALAAKAEAPAPRTELSKRIREAATADVTEQQARLLIGAAEEIERAQQAAAPGALDERALRDMFERDALTHLGIDHAISRTSFTRDDDGGYQYAKTRRLLAFWTAARAQAAPSAPGTPEAPADMGEPTLLWDADDPEDGTHGDNPQDFAENYICNSGINEPVEVDVLCAYRGSKRTMRITPSEDDNVSWSWVQSAAQLDGGAA